VRIPVTHIFHLYEHTLSSIAFDDATMEWVFAFEEGVSLRARAPWRVVADGIVIVGSDDDGQEFGVNAPFDARQRVIAAIGSAPVSSASTNGPGDLQVQFGPTVRLEVFNHSVGYEGWHLWGPGERHVIGLGGGRVHDAESID